MPSCIRFRNAQSILALMLAARAGCFRVYSLLYLSIGRLSAISQQCDDGCESVTDLQLGAQGGTSLLQVYSRKDEPSVSPPVEQAPHAHRLHHHRRQNHSHRLRHLHHRHHSHRLHKKSITKGPAQNVSEVEGPAQNSSEGPAQNSSEWVTNAPEFLQEVNRSAQIEAAWST